MNNEKSRLIATSIRMFFREGTSKHAYRVCYGYTHDNDGQLVIYNPEAKIVRWIFDRYLAGDSLGKILNGQIVVV